LHFKHALEDGELKRNTSYKEKVPLSLKRGSEAGGSEGLIWP